VAGLPIKKAVANFIGKANHRFKSLYLVVGDILPQYKLVVNN
jgi:hypothetical protein